MDDWNACAVPWKLVRDGGRQRIRGGLVLDGFTASPKRDARAAG